MRIFLLVIFMLMAAAVIYCAIQVIKADKKRDALLIETIENIFSAQSTEKKEVKTPIDSMAKAFHEAIDGNSGEAQEP